MTASRSHARLGRRPGSARGRLRAHAGFTVVEVLVATLVLTLGMISLLGAFDSSRTLGTSAEAHQTAVALAQHELERVTAQSWNRIALTARPTQTSTTSKTDPTYYEKSLSTTCKGQGPSETNCYQWNWSSSESSMFEPLVIDETNGDSTADPKTETTYVTQQGKATRFTFKIYRFITWTNDKECKEATCAGERDDKRVLIAVTGSNLDTPVTLVSLVNNSVLGSRDPLKGLNCVDGSETVACVTQK